MWPIAHPVNRNPFFHECTYNFLFLACNTLRPKLATTSGDIMDNDIWAFGRKCESCSPQFSPFHAYSRVSHKHFHRFKKYFTFKNKWSNRYVKSSKYLKASLMQTTNLVANRSNCGSKFHTLTNVIWFRDDFISVHQDLFWFKETNWLLVKIILKSNEFIIKIYICEWEGRFWFSACVPMNDRIRYTVNKKRMIKGKHFVIFI